jgi:peptidoglycan DL-endopeptidase CwlO
VHVALSSRVRRLRPTAPVALTLALAVTAATGTAAAAVRHSDAPSSVATPKVERGGLLALPAAPAPAALPPGAAAQGSAVTPAVTRVARPQRLVEANLLVTSTTSLSKRVVRAVGRVAGVTDTLRVAAGSVGVDGHRARVLGIDPVTFRPWTPRPTARSQSLWQSIARGELTASFDMGKQAGLPLGSAVEVGRSARHLPIRIGAFASMGMAGVDAVVSRDHAAAVGLREATGLVVSAPKADALTVRRAVQQAVAHRVRGGAVHTSLLRQVVVIRDAGEFLTRSQLNTMLQAAASRLGRPYVWGATGPDSFDCSGLVQWSFARAGIYMPRVSQQQWLAGPHVAYEDARPGDLLFWHYDPTDPGNIDHVAIYAGEGMMIVAPKTGDVVKYVPVALNSAFAGVVRVDPGIAAQIG